MNWLLECKHCIHCTLYHTMWILHSLRFNTYAVLLVTRSWSLFVPPVFIAGSCYVGVVAFCLLHFIAFAHQIIFFLVASGCPFLPSRFLSIFLNHYWNVNCFRCIDVIINIIVHGQEENCIFFSFRMYHIWLASQPYYTYTKYSLRLRILFRSSSSTYALD